MNLYLLRVVLKSGSLTELIFDDANKASAAREAVMDGAVSDDYGHEFDGLTADIAATILVDFEAELRGQQLVTTARMVANNIAQRDAATELQKGPAGKLLVPNGSLLPFQS